MRKAGDDDFHFDMEQFYVLVTIVLINTRPAMIPYLMS